MTRAMPTEREPHPSASASIVVLLCDGRRQQVCGRAAAWMLWLAAYAERINAPESGRLEIDFAGASFDPSIRERLPRHP